jgi:recombination protein RecT
MGNQTIQPTNYSRLKDMLRSEGVMEQFERSLGRRSAQFAASLLSVVSGNQKLRECDPTSIVVSAAKAAAMDLPVDPALGRTWLIPYAGKCTFQMGWKGFVDLALRTGEYKIINATKIFEGQEIIEDQLTGVIRLNGHRTGDRVIGYAAYFQLKSGFEKFFYMTVEQVEGHAARFSQGYKSQKADNAWKTSFDEMAKKTVLKYLLSHWGPLTIQMADIRDDDDVPTVEDGRPLAEVIDAEFANEFDNDNDEGYDDDSRKQPAAEQPAQPEPPPANPGAMF